MRKPLAPARDCPAHIIISRPLFGGEGGRARALLLALGLLQAALKGRTLGILLLQPVGHGAYVGYVRLTAADGFLKPGDPAPAAARLKVFAGAVERDQCGGQIILSVGGLLAA